VSLQHTTWTTWRYSRKHMSKQASKQASKQVHEQASKEASKPHNQWDMVVAAAENKLQQAAVPRQVPACHRRTAIPGM
jgi:hypothetical protein